VIVVQPGSNKGPMITIPGEIEVELQDVRIELAGSGRREGEAAIVQPIAYDVGIRYRILLEYRHHCGIGSRT